LPEEIDDDEYLLEDEEKEEEPNLIKDLY